MAKKRRAEIRARDVTGLKYFEKLAPLLARLHDDACARDKAGNRQLHYDQYCLLILLYLFNPIVSSLRSLQQASELANVQQRLGCGRASLGSLAEAASVFDAQRLKEIIAELSDELTPLVRDHRWQNVPRLVAVDGSLLAALPKMMQAASVPRLASADGRLASADGRLASADGRLASADGPLASADGRLASADGRLASADGRLTSADGPLEPAGLTLTPVTTRTCVFSRAF